MWRELTKANIRKSLRLLEGGVPGTDQEFNAAVQAVLQRIPAEGDLERLRVLGACMPAYAPILRPVFYLTEDELRSPQSDYFGFFALRCAVDRVLMSINYLAASQIVLEKRLFGPSISQSYTAAYHGVHAYLALHGRVIEAKPHMPLRKATLGMSEHVPAAVKAKLTRNNTWVFESCARAHAAVWGSLVELFAGRKFLIPHYFLRLFDYMYHMERDPAVALKGSLKHPDEGMPKIRDRLQEFLGRIAETRHLALYRSSGADPYAMDMVLNQEGSGAGMDVQAREFHRFAAGLLEDAATSCCEILRCTEVGDEACRYLNTGFLWFDTPDFGECKDRAVRSAAEQLYYHLSLRSMPPDARDRWERSLEGGELGPTTDESGSTLPS
jgi:hypothetical protein